MNNLCRSEVVEVLDERIEEIGLPRIRNGDVVEAVAQALRCGDIVKIDCTTPTTEEGIMTTAITVIRRLQ